MAVSLLAHLPACQLCLPACLPTRAPASSSPGHQTVDGKLGPARPLAPLTCGLRCPDFPTASALRPSRLGHADLGGWERG